uniref:Uncharacterized protein n=1 Tax=Fervidobacterium pennivorans TaxID=93466 RepID=A0A7V4NEY5_FERPE
MPTGKPNQKPGQGMRCAAKPLIGLGLRAAGKPEKGFRVGFWGMKTGKTGGKGMKTVSSTV